MASMQRMSNDAKIVAAGLLTDIRLTGMIYALVKLAANTVYTSEKVYTNEDKCHVCSYPDETFAIKREVPCTAVTNRARIEYHPDDLTIVGGMALALYDNAIRHIKKERKLGPLKDFLTKNTTDVDMVWWPRIENKPGEPKEIITIQSPAIKEHVEQFKKAIESKFSRRNNVQSIMKLIPHAKSLQITVTHTNILIAGVFHIHIYFTIIYKNDTTIQLEISDIAIHDGASSQLTIGPQGRTILRPMEYDPMYVSQIERNIKNIRIGKIKLHVPIISKLIDQQLLAFSNLLKRNDNKCIINYNRLRYIQYVLAPTNVHRPALLTTFGIEKQDVNRTIVQIDTELQRIITQQCNTGRPELKALCIKLKGYENASQEEYLSQRRNFEKDAEQLLREKHEKEREELQLQQRAQLESAQRQSSQPLMPYYLPPQDVPPQRVLVQRAPPQNLPPLELHPNFVSRNEIRRLVQKQQKGKSLPQGGRRRTKRKHSRRMTKKRH